MVHVIKTVQLSYGHCLYSVTRHSRDVGNILMTHTKSVGG